jgi:mannose-6-phosphate isomerase-like protein (cupin superfamily)
VQFLVGKDVPVTYPPPRYQHADPQHSATYRKADVAPELVYPNGTTISYLATGASTGGLFGMYRWQSGPEETGPRAHYHRSIAESFYVLTGVIQIFDGDRWVDAGPGDWVHVPPGGVHAFHNRSGEPSSMLLHFSPGAPREGYFEGLARLDRMSEDEKTAFYAEHDNIWV